MKTGERPIEMRIKILKFPCLRYRSASKDYEMYAAINRVHRSLSVSEFAKLRRDWGRILKRGLASDQ